MSDPSREREEHEASPHEGRSETPVRATERCGVAPDRAAREIQRCGELRRWREKDVSIGATVAAVKRQTDVVQRKLGDLIGLWETLVPPAIAARTRLSSFRGGTLLVTADSAAVSYELDRRLREGLLTQLRQQFRGTLTRVKIAIGSSEP